MLMSKHSRKRQKDCDACGDHQLWFPGGRIPGNDLQAANTYLLEDQSYGCISASNSDELFCMNALQAMPTKDIRSSGFPQKARSPGIGPRKE